MSVADRLRHLAQVGSVIICPEMTLVAGDHEPAIVTGKGELVVRSTTGFDYVLHGTPADLGHAMRSINRLRSDPYDGLLRQRLHLRTERDDQLSGGWTIARMESTEGSFRFSGSIDSLALEEPPSGQITEVGFLLPKAHRARIILRRAFPEPELPGQSVERHVTVLGTELRFVLEDDTDLLSISIPTGGVFVPPYPENWLGEPLRILFGQPLYPRYVARGLTSSTMAWVRPSPAWSARSDACALVRLEDITVPKVFWDTYSALLALVAGARDAAGQPNFEAHPLTQYYEEVIQAAQGSRWVWALTYASAIEGVMRLLVPRGTVSAMASPAAAAALATHIDDWSGDARLKNIAKAAVARTLGKGAAEALRDLRDCGAVTPGQYKAWDGLRNKVMHGHLVSPYSSAEDDKLLLDLSDLLHAVTRRLIAPLTVDNTKVGGFR